MVGEIHDFVALIQQMAVEKLGDMEAHLIGHVIEYDPKVNMCRVLLPTRRGAADGQEDEPMETGWIQVGTQMVGDRWGFQYCLKGGATKDEPEKGEQVQVSIQHRESGLCAVANLTYNDQMQPPGAGGDGSDQQDEDDPKGWDDDPFGLTELEPCEFIMRHKSGSFLKFYESGDVQLYSANALHAYAQKLDCVVREGDATIDIQKGNLAVTVDEGNTSIKSKGDIDISSGGDINMKAHGDVNITDGVDFSL